MSIVVFFDMGFERLFFWVDGGYLFKLFLFLFFLGGWDLYALQKVSLMGFWFQHVFCGWIFGCILNIYICSLNFVC